MFWGVREKFVDIMRKLIKTKRVATCVTGEEIEPDWKFHYKFFSDRGLCKYYAPANDITHNMEHRGGKLSADALRKAPTIGFIIFPFCWDLFFPGSLEKKEKKRRKLMARMNGQRNLLINTPLRDFVLRCVHVHGSSKRKKNSEQNKF